MTGWVIPVALCLLAVDLPAPSAPDLDRQIQENQQSLDDTRRRLTELEQRLAQLESSEKATLARIGSMDERIRLITGYIRQLESQSVARAREIAEVAGQIHSTSIKVKTRRQALARRLTAVYKYGRILPLEAILTTKSLPEVFRRMTYLRLIARADERTSRELLELNRQLDGQRNRLAAAHAELQALQAEQLAQAVSLKSARQVEAGLLGKVRTERQSRQEVARQLGESAARLQGVIADLERRRRETETPAGSHFFEQSKGKLPWPMQGTVIAGYGSQVHPRYKTRTTNLGIDIKPKAPAPAAAVAAGKVVYSDVFMGYGNLVIVDHAGGFYSLYSNLDEIQVGVGAEVTQGTAVGRVTDYLHFEIRRDGKPVSPGEWLSR